jgi:Zn-dependent protease with chaperone function
MDFFAQQETARRRTGFLIVCFALAVVSIVAVVYVVIAVALGAARGQFREGPLPAEAEPGITSRSLLETLWDPQLMAIVGAGTLTLIGGGTAFKMASLASGGQSVALMLGGKAIHPQTADLDERRILNVVEEMAIASGCPVPPVYVLEEPSINAFAAGYAPDDAVIGITRGALRHLNRDELQGVIAHEFSHILNGDMRINIRLIGLLAGILLISMVGWTIFRMTGNVSYSSGDSRDDRRGVNVLPLVGLAIYIIGYVGVFFAHLIKAAVSRQREFLADASAVQFTRNPDGLAGALKKIGALAEGSRIENPEAEEASHLFFANGMGFFSLFATHPPLVERIRRLDPQFDGDFAKIDTRPVQERGEASTRGTRVESKPARLPLDPVRAVTRIGTVDPVTLATAAALLESLDTRARDLVHDPLGAQGVVYALLLDSENMAIREAQVTYLKTTLPEPIQEMTKRGIQVVAGMSDQMRLALAEVAAMTLKSCLSREQVRSLIEIVQQLVQADSKAVPFEVALQRILLRYLSGGQPPRPPREMPAPAGTSVTPAAGPPVGTTILLTQRLLSALAHAGSSEPNAVSAAFAAGVNRLNWREIGPNALQSPPPTPASTREALLALARARPDQKRAILEAAAATISADQIVTAEEGELFRAVSHALGAPAPPWAGGSEAD